VSRAEIAALAAARREKLGISARPPERLRDILSRRFFVYAIPGPHRRCP